jgi:threonine/homoserine/homoserine lactone efflux protein
MQSVCSLGTASGMTAVLVIALYVNAAEVRTLYSHPNVLWLVCVIVLLWIARLWLIAGRGELGEDPVLFAVRDPSSIVLGALSGLVLLLAL